ncbi:MAG: LysM peptidoglycan-binding domain-containing protein [Candidatus Midichloriaceae bacterium]
MKQGDTLGEIAIKHGVNKEELAKLNGIENQDFIKAGEKLIIPESAKYPSGDNPNYHQKFLSPITEQTEIGKKQASTAGDSTTNINDEKITEQETSGACAASSGACEAYGDVNLDNSKQESEEVLNQIDKELENLNLSPEDENKVKNVLQDILNTKNKQYNLNRLKEDPIIRMIKKGNIEQVDETADKVSKASNIKNGGLEDIKGKVINALGNTLGNNILKKIIPILNIYNIFSEQEKVRQERVEEQKAREFIQSLEGMLKADKLPENTGTPINDNNKPTIGTYPEADKQEPLPGFTPVKTGCDLKRSTIPDKNLEDFTFYSKISESNQKTIQGALNSGDNSKVSDALGKTIDLDIPTEALDEFMRNEKNNEYFANFINDVQKQRDQQYAALTKSNKASDIEASV